MKLGEIVAALVTALIAIPLVFMFARAIGDGEVRRREGPARGFLGDAVFDAFMNGDTPAQHYLGNDRLAPEFELADRHGRPWRLRDQRGKLVVMNFWTVTCGPCVEEMPSFETLAGMVNGLPDVELVTVTVDRSWDVVRPVLAPRTRLKVLFDPTRGVVTEKYGTRLFPETWIIDRDGVIRMRVDGPRDWSSALAMDVIRSYR